MPLYLTGERAVFYAHVPKTGGSSVEAHLAARFGAPLLFDPRWRPHGWAGAPSLGSSPQHMTAADAAAMGVLDRADWVFAVVRDPVDRLLSEYRYVRYLNNPASRAKFLRGGVSVWLQSVLTAVRHAPRIYDNHIRPQTDLVPQSAEVFRLEDGLEAVAARADALFGPRPDGLTMPHHLAGPHQEPIRLSAADLRLIVETYADDYERFGYAPPDFAAGASGGIGARIAGRALGYRMVRAAGKGWL